MICSGIRTLDASEVGAEIHLGSLAVLADCSDRNFLKTIFSDNRQSDCF